jgi:hypothetical protein
MTPPAPHTPPCINKTMNAFLDIAAGGPDRVPGDLQIPNPRLFVADLFRAIAILPSTRPAMNHLMDVLFALPAVAPLLVNAGEVQADIANAIHLTALPPLFQAHWQYVIIPAWNQEAQVHALVNDQPQADRNQYAGLRQ